MRTEGKKTCGGGARRYQEDGLLEERLGGGEVGHGIFEVFCDRRGNVYLITSQMWETGDTSVFTPVDFGVSCGSRQPNL